MKKSVLILAAMASLLFGPTGDAVPNDQTKKIARYTVMDQPTPAIKINSLGNNDVVSSPFELAIEVRDYEIVASEAQSLPQNYANGYREPNRGHWHYWADKIEDDPDFSARAAFGGATDATTRTVNLEPGRYVSYACLQQHDHTTRVVAFANDFPVCQAVYIEVK